MVLLGIAIFQNVRDHQFVYYDDNPYILENPFIQRGLTSDGIFWAFRADLLEPSPYVDYWQPVTILSRLMDVDLFGINPAGHHLMNLFFHLVSAILLFLLLLKTTGAFWKSALVGILFMSHPLQVEAVSWVTARKDVLSTFLGLLAIWFYVKSIQGKKSDRLISVGLFLLALMAKSTLVILPFLLLLLDFWPLKRSRIFIREKWPYFLASIIFYFIPFMGQPHSLNYTSNTVIISKAFLNYMIYLGKFFLPIKLGIYSRFNIEDLSIFKILFSFVIIVWFSFYCVKVRKSKPYLFVGWFWFLIALFPTIFLNMIADRFVYVSVIGLLVALIWFASGKKVTIFLSVAIIVLCSGMSWRQVGYWKDSTALFKHSLEIDQRNFTVHNNLGLLLLDEGKYEEALIHFLKTLEIAPEFAQVYNNIGLVMKKQGKRKEELRFYLESVRRVANLEKVYYNIANWYGEEKDLEKTIFYLERAIHANPNYAAAHFRLAQVFYYLKEIPKANWHHERAIALFPSYANQKARVTAIDSLVDHADEITRQHEFD